MDQNSQCGQYRASISGTSSGTLSIGCTSRDEQHIFKRQKYGNTNIIMLINKTISYDKM